MVFRLDDDYIEFPDPRYSDDSEYGFFAVGGDISPERMIEAYSYGILPWFDFHDEPRWYCPLNRFVIFPDEIHISHSLRSLFNKQKYHTTVNTDFETVIRGCAKGSAAERRNDAPGAWLGEQMISTLLALHNLGRAVSVEVRDRDGAIVGGLYGILSGKIFCGESMYSLRPSASKIAMVALARWCRENGIALIDCQFHTPHLESMGARYIPYEQYLRHNSLQLLPLPPLPAIRLASQTIVPL